MNLITEISRKLEVPESYVFSIIASGPLKYKVYSIPKRTRGRRIIAHPAKELKKVQKTFISICKFPVHDSAMAYREGISIKDNAELHKSNNYLLKMDFENFFNSITPILFWDVWKQHFNEPSILEKKIIESIVFWAPNILERDKLVLSVGAPSSPEISNFCLYKFDTIIKNYCSKNNITYTRYADDITFSSSIPKQLSNIPNIVRNTLQSIYKKRIDINNQKTIFSSKAHNRHVTGVTITPDGKLSIGRARKRYIKHLVHQYIIGNLIEEDLNHLRGLLSFARHIEKDFYLSLQTKYSLSLINEIVRAKNE